ncbi:hypothetical protein AAG906_003786 [Vitis piasezkii]|uniref:Uncharacterized protein n=2 Tax=Vitis vinifera TaxID=29760 RepID=A0ABY9CZ62_VITVI|eukprot:XP_002263203.1 PREDICTED: uncharacterized protein LOC100267991 [Vitis vinifera]
MGNMKFSVFVLLLVCGVVLLGETSKSFGAKACPLYCLDVDYMTCVSSGEEKLTAPCNCCLAPKQCTLHLVDGSEVQCD